MENRENEQNQIKEKNILQIILMVILIVFFLCFGVYSGIRGNHIIFVTCSICLLLLAMAKNLASYFSQHKIRIFVKDLVEIETERIKQEIKSNKELPAEKKEQLLEKFENYKDVMIAATGISNPSRQEIEMIRRKRAIDALPKD